MPMMSIATAKKAERLIQERSRIAGAKLTAIKGKTKAPISGHLGVLIDQEIELQPDEELAWAIEEFRKRKLDAIDAQLRELGVDPTKEETTAEPVGDLTSEPVGDLRTERVGSLRTVRRT